VKGREKRNDETLIRKKRKQKQKLMKPNNEHQTS